MTLVDEDSGIYHEGVDRKQLAHIKQYFLALNQERFARTMTSLSERQQHFLNILPLFFHVNHPMLPGYVGHQTPSGVHGYSPSKSDVRAATSIARSFRYQRDLLDKHYAIDALFMMGSSGTVAHSEASDIDVWVCCNPHLNALARDELHTKCQYLSRWAADVIHIEAHFFLMDADKFIQGPQSTLSSEASGSAQHFLLLDEFYRSAIWLAGKLPLWWFVPAEQEKNYREYASNLLKKRFVSATDVIDFGGVPVIPANEFVGAGVWQLYKGIDSPYKSVLKLLLLEAYADDQFCEPLSLDLKRKIYAMVARLNSTSRLNAKVKLSDNGNIQDSANEVDAYVLFYQRLENYLLFNNQLVRLELVRRCFYFKVGKSLSKTSRVAVKSWQRLLLEKMVSTWQWPHAHLTMLDNRAYWKSPHVMVERNLLANELNQAYRLLLSMNKNSVNEAAISSQELLILGRKLHAEFERKAGKIDWINPNISLDLHEATLCFVQTVEDDVSIWKAYRGSQQDLSLRVHAAEPIKRSRNFIELLVWCYCNGIFSTSTKLDVESKDFLFHNSQRQRLLQAIKNWLPLPILKPEHECFAKSSQPDRIILLFNMGIEPQAELNKRGLRMLSSQGDAFGYSGFKENLVMRADIVQTNSWGEVVCRHFATDALISCLLHFLRSIPPHKNATLPELTICCFSVGQGGTIEQRVRALWRAIIQCFYTGTDSRNARFLFEMADEYVLLQFIQQQPQILRFKTYDMLLEKLSATQIEFSPIVVDAFALHGKPLRLLCETMTAPGIYIFYKLDAKQAEVSILDHKGSLFIKTFFLFNVPTLLRPLCYFIRSTVERLLLENDINIDVVASMETLQRITIFEVMGDAKQKNMRVEPRVVGQDLSQLNFIKVCVVAEPTHTNQLSFTIFCDGKEFSELEFGVELFAAVARYILTCRQYGETYPCYITELDLSLCRDCIAPQTGVQLIHYLQIKNELEEKLNHAVKNL